jgi:hypothetical protein
MHQPSPTALTRVVDLCIVDVLYAVAAVGAGGVGGKQLPSQAGVEGARALLVPATQRNEQRDTRVCVYAVCQPVQQDS